MTPQAIYVVMKKQLVTKEYVDNNIMKKFLDVDAIPDLKPYYGRSIYITINKNVVINGITIPAWSSIYFPCISGNDYIGIAAYPDASSCFILGHTVEGYYIHKLY